MLLVLFEGVSFAGNWYVAQTAQGGDTGVDAANAHSAVWFNTSGNWGAGAGKVNPGDTVHLAGTITSALTVQASGTIGNVTTVLFDPGANMTSAAWPLSGAIIVSGRSYIIVDGGATGTIGGPSGNPALANGIIESTDNGPAFGNHVANSIGVVISDCNSCVVRGLVIRNLYVRASGTDEVSNGNNCVKVSWGGGGSTYGNISVTNCIFHDAERGVLFVFGPGWHDLEEAYCTAYNCNWGGGCGSNGSGCDLTTLLIHHNRFSSWANWDDTSVGNFYHHNGFFAFTSLGHTGSLITAVRYYSNFIGPYWGTRSSSGLWVQDKVTDVWTYNNVVISDPVYFANDGLIGFNPAGATTGTYRAYNNTLVGQGQGAGINVDAWQNTGGAQTVICKNNLIVGCTFMTVYNNATFTVTSDHNLGFNLKSAQNFSYSTTSSASFKTLGQWQGLGFDTDLVVTDPTFVNAANNDYHLIVGSPAINVGADLSAFFTTDNDGKTRPAGAWDIGAFEYVAPSAAYTTINVLSVGTIIQK